MEQSQLDLIDEVIFDADASVRVRQEALLFLMDHTEGFDDVETNNDVGNGNEDNTDNQRTRKSTSAKSKSSSKSKLKSKKEDEIGLMRRQRAARQLETFTEFIQYQTSRWRELGDTTEANMMLSNAADMLVEVSSGLSISRKINFVLFCLCMYVLMYAFIFSYFIVHVQAFFATGLQLYHYYFVRAME